MANRGFFQEKFQFFNAKPKPSTNNEWADQKSTGRKFKAEDVYMPVGDLAKEHLANDFEAITLGGTRSAETQINAKSIKTGFNCDQLEPTDDNYTGEHADPFYNTIELEDGTGFCERHNYMDRL